MKTFVIDTKFKRLPVIIDGFVPRHIGRIHRAIYGDDMEAAWPAPVGGFFHLKRIWNHNGDISVTPTSHFRIQKSLLYSRQENVPIKISKYLLKYGGFYFLEGNTLKAINEMPEKVALFHPNGIDVSIHPVFLHDYVGDKCSIRYSYRRDYKIRVKYTPVNKSVD